MNIFQHSAQKLHFFHGHGLVDLFIKIVRFDAGANQFTGHFVGPGVCIVEPEGTGIGHECNVEPIGYIFRNIQIRPVGKPQKIIDEVTCGTGGDIVHRMRKTVRLLMGMMVNRDCLHLAFQQILPQIPQTAIITNIKNNGQVCLCQIMVVVIPVVVAKIGIFHHKMEVFRNR